MTERDDIEAQLQEYLQSLSADRRPVRDRGGRRQRLLPPLRAHAARERRRVQRRRALVRAAGLIALGGAAATALWLVLPRVGALRASTTATMTAPSVSVPLAEAIVFEAPADRPARVRVGDLVTMTLAAGSRARPVVPAGATSSLAVALERGRAHFEVQKLHGNRRFHVMTPDADVEVRGTVFDVALSPRAAAPTCVSVDEGLVQVAKGTRTRLLGRGESWDCDTANDSTNAAPAAETPAIATEPAPPPPDKSVHRRRRIRQVAPADTERETDPPREIADPRGGNASAPGVATSDLRAQNEIFRAALSAQRAEQTDEAAGLYRQLIGRAPGGPLAAQARANLAAITARAVEKEGGAR